MDTKLTLRLDEDIISRAKKYASERKISLSKLIENYLATLNNEKKNEIEISPFVKSISTGKSTPVGIEEDYKDYLAQKYK